MSLSHGHSAPRTLGHLFWAFSVLSLQGFGGVLAVVHRELVDKRRWLTDAEFVEDWAVAQVLPGPNVCNLALMFGDRHLGWRGALVALAGLLTFPLVLLVAVSLLLGPWIDQPAVTGALRGMGAVAAGLIAGSALKLLLSIKQHVLGTAAVWLLAALAFAGVVGLHLSLHTLVLGLGSVACGLTGLALRRRTRP
ncbi:MAG TPA: chromate transporter [Burkholderiaceae bacterium]|nr:chromate transporter [Burkholderiaceae bacterium]